MATTKLYLKDPKTDGKSLIYLFFNYGKRRLKYSTGESIEPKNWNFDNQKVKKSMTSSVVINDYLQSLNEKVNEIYRHGKMEGKEPTTDELREKLNKAIDKQTNKPKTFFGYFDEFIEVRRAQMGELTIKKYRNLYNHLTRFQQAKRFNLSFDKINATFEEKFVTYLLNDRKLTNNTIAKNIKVLKTFLHWATKHGYNKNQTFVEFKAVETDADIIYLTEQELMHIYNFDLSNNKRLERVRDFLCFECFTSLRYSDVERVKKENIRDGILHIYTKKTQDKLEIPLNGYAMELLEKYDYQLPIISNQNMNVYLKELGRVCGINEPTSLTKYSGRNEQTETGEKWQFFSTHLGRRTFVTLSLEKGMRVETVMSITGHKDYNTMKKYLKLTNKVKVVEMNRVWAKEPKEAPSLLKAV